MAGRGTTGSVNSVGLLYSGKQTLDGDPHRWRFALESESTKASPDGAISKPVRYESNMLNCLRLAESGFMRSITCI